MAYKIFLKIIVGRFTYCLDHIIFLEQRAFHLRRNIFENITLAQEMIHSLNKKVTGGNEILKVDMAKVYDCVEYWRFLQKVMEGFRLSSRVCNLIANFVKFP